MLYKVVSENVVIDDVEFVKDQLVELEADALNVADLLAEGAIVETSEDAELEEAPEPTLDGEAEPLPASEGTHQADEVQS